MLALQMQLSAETRDPHTYTCCFAVVPNATLYAADVPAGGVNVTTKINETLEIKSK